MQIRTYSADDHLLAITIVKPEQVTQERRKPGPNLRGKVPPCPQILQQKVIIVATSFTGTTRIGIFPAVCELPSIIFFCSMPHRVGSKILYE